MLKSNVTFLGIRPETVLGILIAFDLYQKCKQEFVITSITDGLHKSGSLHYDGLAFDIRTFNLRGISGYEMVDRLKEALGSQFDVVLEPSHIHVEFDP